MPSRRVTPNEVRKMIASLDGAVEGSHMNHPDFRANGRIFASLSPDETRVNMKVSSASLDLLIRQDPDTFHDVWGGRWLGVILSRASRAELRGLLRDAWAMTITQPTRRPKSEPSRGKQATRKRR